MKYLFFFSIIAALAVGLVSPAVSRAHLDGGFTRVKPDVTGSVFQSVASDQAAYDTGDSIKLLYTITNNSNAPAVFEFRSGKQYDIWVTYQGAEVYRLSRGKMYIQSIGNLTLQPGASKQFTAVWQPKQSGIILQRGTYVVHAQLLPTSGALTEVVSTFRMGPRDDVVVPLTVSEAIRRSAELIGKNVMINAVYMGWKGDSSDANLKDGPPMTRSDWVITDPSGSMYVSGTTSLDPNRNIGARVSVVGKLARTPKGQVYLVAQRVSILK